MVKRIVFLISAVCFCVGAGVGAATSWADVVYLNDGREIEGTVTKADGKVNIKQADGKTITVPAGDVLYITSPPADKPPAETAPPVETTPAPSTPASASDKPAQPSVEFAADLGKNTSQGSLSMPESTVFKLLRRKLADTTAGSDDSLERRIKQYRGLAHDRKRYCIGKWLSQAHYIRRRELFEKFLKEAEDEFRQASSSSGGTKTSDAQKEKEQKGHITAGRRKLQKAAGTWADPLLRTFLLAVAAYESEEYLRSAALFQRLTKQAPSIPAFQQGYAMALAKRESYDIALVAYMNLLRLCPNSSEVTTMLARAISEVPGNRIETKTFKQAKKMLARYSASSRGRSTSRRRTRRRSSWLFPGRKVTAKARSLPILPMDRFSFYQAVAVPVSEHILLVDRKIVADAQQVGIRIDADTIALAKVKTSRRNKDLPFAMLEVTGYKFTPVEISQTAEMGVGGLFAVALGINCIEEMGSRVRNIPVKAKSISSEGKIEVSAGLWPGESAGPVFDSNGRFVGFLAGKTDPNNDKSPNLLYTRKDLDSLLKRAISQKKRSGKTSSSKQKIKPRPAKGNSFIIQAVICERFEEE